MAGSIRTKKRAVLYLRVSDPRQVERFSLDTQEKACREYCERQGWEVAEVFREEGESAKTTDRTELKRLMAWAGRAKKGRADYLVVYRLSRSARDAGDYLTLKAWFQQRGIAIRSVMETVEDNAAGRLLETVLAAINQFDNEQRAESSKAGMKQAAAEGRWCWKAPRGYKNAHKELVVDDAVAPAIQWAFRACADGVPLAEIGLKLAKRGVKTRTGHHLRPEAVRIVLRNPVYCGRLIVKDWGIETHGNWEALVPRKLWLEAQDSLAQRRQQKPGTRHVALHQDFPLRRWLLCDLCGKPIRASWSRSKTGVKYPYYSCHACATRVRKERLERDWISLLGDLTPSRPVLKIWRSMIEAAWEEREGDASRRQEAARKQIRTLEDRRERLLDLYLDGGLSKERFESKQRTLDEDLVNAELEVETAKAGLDLKSTLSACEDFLIHPGRFWEEGTLELRWRLQSVVFPEGVHWAPKTGFRTPASGNVFSALGMKSEGKSRMVPRQGSIANLSGMAYGLHIVLEYMVPRHLDGAGNALR